MSDSSALRSVDTNSDAATNKCKQATYNQKQYMSSLSDQNIKFIQRTWSIFSCAQEMKWHGTNTNRTLSLTNKNRKHHETNSNLQDAHGGSSTSPTGLPSFLNPKLTICGHSKTGM